MNRLKVKRIDLFSKAKRVFERLQLSHKGLSQSTWCKDKYVKNLLRTKH